MNSYDVVGSQYAHNPVVGNALDICMAARSRFTPVREYLDEILELNNHSKVLLLRLRLNHNPDLPIPEEMLPYTDTVIGKSIEYAIKLGEETNE